MMLKKMNKSYMYEIHVLLNNDNELKCKLLTDKTKEQITELINTNLDGKVQIEKTYSIASQPAPDFIDSDLLE